MIKYTNRGLVNDRYYWNMNWSLLRTLFWTGNIVMLVSDQANYLATYLEHGHSIFAYTYRFDCQTSSLVIGLKEKVQKFLLSKLVDFPIKWSDGVQLVH